MLLLMMTMPFLLGSIDPTRSAAPPQEPPIWASLKLGVQVSPLFSFAGGFDLELNRLRIAPKWITRIDADILFQPVSDGHYSSFNTDTGITLNQIYSGRQARGRRVYAGAGVGVYDIYRQDGNGILFATTYDTKLFGGKIILGTEITSTTSAEMNVHLISGKSPLLAFQVRLKF